MMHEVNTIESRWLRTRMEIRGLHIRELRKRGHKSTGKRLVCNHKCIYSVSAAVYMNTCSAADLGKEASPCSVVVKKLLQ